MYLDTFGLTRSPFTPEIPPEALYHYHSFKQGAHRLKYAVQQRGMVVLTGPAGSGKTTLLRYLAHQLAPSNYPVYYANASLLPSPLAPVIDSLLTQMGESVPYRHLAKAIVRLKKAVLRSHHNNRTPVIIIDEAHLLNDKGWLLLKTLSAYEMDATLPLCLVLVGGAEPITRILRLNHMEEIRQRLLFCYELKALTADEVEPYLQHRLKWSGTERPLFPRDVAVEIHRLSRGLPRTINQLGHGSLLAAASEQKNLVDHICLEQACSEILLPGP